MKLSQLVEYYQQLKSYNIDETSLSCQKILQTVRNAVNDNKVPLTHDKIRFGDGTYLDAIDNDIKRYESTISSIKSNLNFYIDQIEDAISEIEQGYLEDSRDVFNNGMRHDDADVILGRKLDIPEDAEKIIRNRLSVYSDWRYPGLCVGPMRTALTDELVSSDPLYLCDIDESLIDPLVSSYNDVYRHRVRPYVIPRYENGRKLFRELPKNQFGIIFVAHFFEYIPLEDIGKILSEIWDLLRPGGTVMFTFNDCDNPKNIQLAEKNYRTYSPKRSLKDIVTGLGFNIQFSYDASFGFSWMELRRPGKLETVRGGQSLAQIISTNDVVITPKKTYTEKQIEQIHQEAIALGIDSEMVIRSGNISLGKLELLIERRKHAIKAERKLIDDIGKQNSKDS